MTKTLARILLPLGLVTAIAAATAEELSLEMPAASSSRAAGPASASASPAAASAAPASTSTSPAATGTAASAPSPAMSDPLFQEFRTLMTSGEPRRWKMQVDLVTTLIRKYPDDGSLIGMCNVLAGYVRLPVDDDELVAKRKEYLHKELDRLLALPDIGPAWPNLFYVKVEHALRALQADGADITSARLAEVRGWLDELSRRAPQMDQLPGVEQAYLEILQPRDPAAYAAQLAKLADSPNPGVKQMAQGLLKRAAVEHQSLQMNFAAVDGREVDLAKLRGKVVLIDFWATWCGPCIEELPNVKKVYEKYHTQGFEVIGIALENGRLSSGDTPDQTTAKLAEAKKVLSDFTAKNGLPWPQYFDGKYWKTRYAVDYSVNAIPAMFLLDQEGRVVSTSARGEQLEVEVRRLLKL